MNEFQGKINRFILFHKCKLPPQMFEIETFKGVLTNRQYKILSLWLNGLSLKEIATKLKITNSGVRQHLYGYHDKGNKYYGGIFFNIKQTFGENK